MYEKIRSKKGFISDMDGVLYHGNNLLPGVVDFVNWLQENEKEFITVVTVACTAIYVAG